MTPSPRRTASPRRQPRAVDPNLQRQEPGPECGPDGDRPASLWRNAGRPASRRARRSHSGRGVACQRPRCVPRQGLQGGRGAQDSVVRRRSSGSRWACQRTRWRRRRGGGRRRRHLRLHCRWGRRRLRRQPSALEHRPVGRDLGVEGEASWPRRRAPLSRNRR